jgi:hypothetical protein
MLAALNGSSSSPSSRTHMGQWAKPAVKKRMRKGASLSLLPSDLERLFRRHTCLPAFTPIVPSTGPLPTQAPRLPAQAVAGHGCAALCLPQGSTPVASLSVALCFCSASISVQTRAGCPASASAGPWDRLACTCDPRTFEHTLTILQSVHTASVVVQTGSGLPFFGSCSHTCMLHDGPPSTPTAMHIEPKSSHID